jgi:hypothetical protein
VALEPCGECGAEISTSAPICPHCGAPAKRTNRLGGCASALAVLVVIVVAALFLRQGVDTVKQANEGPDIVQNKSFLAANPKYLPEIRTLITSSGYACPQILHLWSREQSPTVKLEAVCGSASDAKPPPHYAVYTEQRKVVVWEAAAQQDTTNNEDTKEAADPSDLMANKKFLADNPHYLDAIRTLIINSGYECPRLATLFLSPDNPTPLGTKLEAMCGPRGSTNVYTALHYSVYPDRLTVVVCKPFGVLSNGCE